MTPPRQPRSASLLVLLALLMTTVAHPDSSAIARLHAQPAVAAQDSGATAILAEARAAAERDRRTVARGLFEKALALFEANNDVRGVARTQVAAGANRFVLGEHQAGMEQARQGLAALRRLYDASGSDPASGQALAEAVLLATPILPRGAEKAALVNETLIIARASGAASEACGLIFSRAVDARSSGVYVDAFAAAQDALACYDALPDGGRRGRVLLVIAAMEADHGQFHRARARYREAQTTLERQGDILGQVSSWSGLASIASALFEPEQAQEAMSRALRMARDIGAETLTPALGGQLGSFYVTERDFARAKPLLDEALAHETNRIRRALFLLQSCRVEMALAQFDAAARACEEAIELSRPEGPSLMMDALRWRGELRRARGDTAGAAADLAAGIVMAEEARARSLPLDFMKRGFSEWQQELFTSSIALSMQMGDTRTALETAERARARSFLDLLATRDSKTDDREPGGSPSPATATASGANSASPSTDNGQRAAPSSTATQGTSRVTGDGGAGGAAAGAGTRGAEASPATTRGAAFAGDGLANDVVGVPEALENSRTLDAPGIAAMTATARRLQSTLLVYWVSPDATFIWVVTPSGDVHARTVAVAQKDLVRLVREARAPADAAATTGALTLLPSQRRPWRALYDHLIAPIATVLPRTPAALLTIVPHGPLFQVSFAGLRDADGRYLLERYRLHYTPAIGVLEHTARTTAARTTAARATTAGRGGAPLAGALLVGDPLVDAPPEPAASETPGLLPLPWARREVEAIAAMLPGSPTVLIGDAATETAVRAHLRDRAILHFATHGVVESSESLASYLVLRATPPSAPDATADGRLTAAEVYGLQLDAELVVLSACGSALGPTMTGDGVIGFTRAFLYPRASSVIATQWNVPDISSYEIMRGFYAARRDGHTVSDALRRAQLATLAALRRGRATVGAADPGEHPLLWASFVIAGEP